jgi:hypothetical protein
MESNECVRRSDQDRGPTQNFLGDLQGALAELLLLRELDAAFPEWSVRACLYDVGGGGTPGVRDKCDAEVTLGEETQTAVPHSETMRPTQRTDDRPALRYGIEAKAHMHLSRTECKKYDIPYKSDFAINAEAIAKAEGRRAFVVIPYLVALCSSVALRGAAIPLADIWQWDLVEYSRRRAIARRAPLHDLAPSVWGTDVGEAQRMAEERRLEAISPDRLTDLAEVARHNRSDPGFGPLRDTTMRDAEITLTAMWPKLLRPNRGESEASQPI